MWVLWGWGWEGRALVKINATFIFKKGAHLLEWPEVCKQWSGNSVIGAVCLPGSCYIRQGRHAGKRGLATCQSLTCPPRELCSSSRNFLESLLRPGGELWFISHTAVPQEGCIYTMGQGLWWRFLLLVHRTCQHLLRQQSSGQSTEARVLEMASDLTSVAACPWADWSTSLGFSFPSCKTQRLKIKLYS